MEFPEARILNVDLTGGKITTTIIPGEIYRLYPGGSALGLYLILNEMAPGVDPLSPENMLIFSVSPLTGLPISGASRLMVTTKSPLTGGIGDSQAGGFLPAHLKASGWDAVVFRGRSPKPVYLYIHGDQAEIRDAGGIWGRVTGEAEQLIRQDLGTDGVEIAQIGPAGENRVRYAAILNMCSRANGRNGTGAVMGSKNLKAVVVKKVKPRIPYDKTGLAGLTQNIAARKTDNGAMDGLGEHGTDSYLIGYHDEGFLPTRNWTSGWFPEGAEKITGTTMTETILIKRDTCYACAVRCKRVVEVPGKVDPRYGGPEYETAACFGSYCGISDLESIALANQLCNMYGLDTMSCGATIAFAMECFEKGLLTLADTDGLEVRFGAAEMLPLLIKKIATRQGFGALLAEGSARLAQKLGGEALKLAMTVKGQELPAHMPQYKPGVGIIYAVNPFGCDHQSSEHDDATLMPADSPCAQRLAQVGLGKSFENTFVMDDDKVRFAFDSQCFFSIAETLGLCQFVWGPAWELYGPGDLVNLCQSGIGWETSLFELMRVGERRINMMRFFNAREGFTKTDDRLPERLFAPMPDGPSQGHILDREKFYAAVDRYYQFAGWDPENGNPTAATLGKLSLAWLLEKEQSSVK